MVFLEPSLTNLMHAPLAYLDAGSAAMVVQALVAGVAGLILFVRLQGRRVLGLFGRSKDAGDGSGEDA